MFDALHTGPGRSCQQASNAPIVCVAGGSASCDCCRSACLLWHHLCADGAGNPSTVIRPFNQSTVSRAASSAGLGCPPKHTLVLAPRNQARGLIAAALHLSSKATILGWAQEADVLLISRCKRLIRADHDFCDLPYWSVTFPLQLSVSLLALLHFYVKWWYASQTALPTPKHRSFSAEYHRKIVLQVAQLSIPNFSYSSVVSMLSNTVHKKPAIALPRSTCSHHKV